MLFDNRSTFSFGFTAKPQSGFSFSTGNTGGGLFGAIGNSGSATGSFGGGGITAGGLFSQNNTSSTQCGISSSSGNNFGLFSSSNFGGDFMGNNNMLNKKCSTSLFGGSSDSGVVSNNAQSMMYLPPKPTVRQLSSVVPEWKGKFELIEEKIRQQEDILEDISIKFKNLRKLNSNTIKEYEKQQQICKSINSQINKSNKCIQIENPKVAKHAHLCNQVLHLVERVSSTSSLDKYSNSRATPGMYNMLKDSNIRLQLPTALTSFFLQNLLLLTEEKYENLCCLERDVCAIQNQKRGQKGKEILLIFTIIQNHYEAIINNENLLCKLKEYILKIKALCEKFDSYVSLDISSDENFETENSSNYLLANKQHQTWNLMSGAQNAEMQNPNAFGKNLFGENASNQNSTATQGAIGALANMNSIMSKNNNSLFGNFSGVSGGTTGQGGGLFGGQSQSSSSFFLSNNLASGALPTQNTGGIFFSSNSFNASNRQTNPQNTTNIFGSNTGSATGTCGLFGEGSLWGKK